MVLESFPCFGECMKDHMRGCDLHQLASCFACLVIPCVLFCVNSPAAKTKCNLTLATFLSPSPPLSLLTAHSMHDATKLRNSLKSWASVSASKFSW